MASFVIISGCSGGGKSALLDALGRRGYATIPEPGRRIVREQLEGCGTALPWCDEVAFVRQVLARAGSDLDGADHLKGRWVFFDRGLLDAALALQHLTGEPPGALLRWPYRYHRRVFMAPPWPEIYVTDDARRHSLERGIEEYQRLVRAYPALGYEVVALPRAGLHGRADFVLQTLAEES